jgi:hypothetical protein
VTGSALLLWLEQLTDFLMVLEGSHQMLPQRLSRFFIAPFLNPIKNLEVLRAMLFIAFSVLHGSIRNQTADITVVASYPAGVNNNIRARMLAVPVAAALGKTIIIENKAGASGNIGHDFVSKAAADGYTLGIGAMGPLAVNQAVSPKMAFDPAQAFTPIVLIDKAPLVLVTKTDKPGSLTIGNAGTGALINCRQRCSSKRQAYPCCRFPTKVAGQPLPHCCQGRLI